ncbi:hypothetical protein TWF718_009852 [Orbilia javanica]|uniref:Uncharacterized protein n=1 Tax=Orbilia javanica TaxID=47235 RepID=A0AAN8N0B1_9PEZI
MGVVTSWTAPDRHTIIFFDAADSIREQLTSSCEHIRQNPAMRNPYWAHEFLIGPIVACYDHAVWNLRDQVKALETQRREGKSQVTNTIESNDRDINESGTTFNALHEILRHALHATETIGVAIQTLKSICSRKKTFDEERYSADAAAKKETAQSMILLKRCAKKIGVYLDFQSSVITSLEARAKANEARIRSEITLAFSTVAQLDSRLQAEIGNAARADSYTMVKIAAVTMLFLPPSFVSAIFSTSFFEFKPAEGEAVSKDFWIFWAISIPLTVIVFVSLYPGNRGLLVRGRISNAAHLRPLRETV